MKRARPSAIRSAIGVASIAAVSALAACGSDDASTPDGGAVAAPATAATIPDGLALVAPAEAAATIVRTDDEGGCGLTFVDPGHGHEHDPMPGLARLMMKVERYWVMEGWQHEARGRTPAA